jgi:hypothetical protein
MMGKTAAAIIDQRPATEGKPGEQFLLSMGRWSSI